MTHVRIWKFSPREGREQEFAAAYGPDGAWSKLFSLAAGYCGTTLLGPAETGGSWLTVDRWKSLAHFEEFLRDFRELYFKMDAEFEGIAGDEEFVGAFEETTSATES